MSLSTVLCLYVCICDFLRCNGAIQITVVLRCNGAIPSTVSLCTVLCVCICDFFGAMVQFKSLWFFGAMVQFQALCPCARYYVYVSAISSVQWCNSNHCGSSVQWCNSKHYVPVHGTMSMYLRFLRCNGAIQITVVLRCNGAIPSTVSLCTVLCLCICDFFGAMVQFKSL